MTEQAAGDAIAAAAVEAAGEFRFWTREIVRFADVDRYRHINNVAMATYCESGRVAFAEAVAPGSTSGEGAGWVIVRLAIDFVAQAHFPGEVAIGTRVDHIGRSSCRLIQGLYKDGICFARAESIVVWTDPESAGRSSPIPQAIRDALDVVQDPPAG